MPSSHANSLAYFGAYVSLILTTGQNQTALSYVTAVGLVTATLGLVRGAPEVSPHTKGYDHLVEI